MFQSTPNKYIQQLQELNKTYPVRKDDSFPYAENENQYWSGFYTSRPEMKKHARETSSRFHSMLRLSSLEVLRQQQDDSLSKRVIHKQKKLLDILGVVQHHDAITGTGKKEVAEDFFEMLNTA